jgi:hypothetical protein
MFQGVLILLFVLFLQMSLNFWMFLSVTYYKIIKKLSNTIFVVLKYLLRCAAADSKNSRALSPSDATDSQQQQQQFAGLKQQPHQQKTTTSEANNIRKSSLQQQQQQQKKPHDSSHPFVDVSNTSSTSSKSAGARPGTMSPKSNNNRYENHINSANK